MLVPNNKNVSNFVLFYSIIILFDSIRMEDDVCYVMLSVRSYVLYKQSPFPRDFDIAMTFAILDAIDRNRMKAMARYMDRS